ncbi:hypothetical protein LTR95_004385 [Oleoguttula sp. CCFEE 5521]
MEAGPGASTRSYNTIEASGYATLHAGDAHHYTREAIGRDRFGQVTNFSQVNHYNIVIGPTRAATPDPSGKLQPPPLPPRAGSAPPRCRPADPVASVTASIAARCTTNIAEARIDKAPNAQSQCRENDTAANTIDWHTLSRLELISYIACESRALFSGIARTSAEFEADLHTRGTSVLRREAETMHLVRQCREALDQVATATTDSLTSRGNDHAGLFKPNAANRPYGKTVQSSSAVAQESFRYEKSSIAIRVDSESVAGGQAFENMVQSLMAEVIRSMESEVALAVAAMEQGNTVNPRQAAELKRMVEELSRAQHALDCVWSSAMHSNMQNPIRNIKA